MSIFQRISQLISANINHILDKAEEPEVMVKQLIRDMEEGIIELRRETVRAIGTQKQLSKKLEMGRAQQQDLDKKAVLVLESGDEELARKVLEKKLDLEKSIEHLEKDQASAEQLAERLKSDLTRLEDQVQVARRKKEELIRRKLSAEARIRTQEALNKSHEALGALGNSVDRVDSATSKLDDYQDKILQMEAEAEAEEELSALDDSKLAELEKLSREKAVEDELARLKAQLDSKKE